MLLCVKFEELLAAIGVVQPPKEGEDEEGGSEASYVAVGDEAAECVAAHAGQLVGKGPPARSQDTAPSAGLVPSRARAAPADP